MIEIERKRSPKKKNKKKDILYNVLIGLVFVVGLLVLLYPTISDVWNRHRNKNLITQYSAVLESLTPEDYDKLWADARAYNEKHVLNVFSDAFNDEDYELTHPYDQLLNPTGNNIMGYIDVPKIGQKLAIGHGTGAAILEQGVGHVEGTSLPIGGPGTHAVLAGHRGLPSAKIFSDLDQVVEGDKFFLYILDEVLAYEIDQIEIVLPDNDEFLHIEEGEDLVTLLTCTPYGVNSHRMLVRGHRIPYVPEDIIEQQGEHRISERDKPILFAVAGLVLVFLIVIGMRLILAGKKKKEKEDKEQAALIAAQETANRALAEAEKAALAAEEAKQAALLAQRSEEKDEIHQAIVQAQVAAEKAREASEKAKAIVDEQTNRQ